MQDNTNLIAQLRELATVFVGAHRRPTGVILSFERYLQLLDQIDNLVIAATIRQRERADNGNRTSLDEIIEEFGFDRAQLEAEIELQERPACGGQQLEKEK